MLNATEKFPENRDELLGIISNLSIKNIELIAANEEQGTIIHRLETQNEQLASRLYLLEEQLRLLKYKRFCKSSERTVPQQRGLFDEAEAVAELEPATEAELETITFGYLRFGVPCTGKTASTTRRRLSKPTHYRNRPAKRRMNASQAAMLVSIIKHLRIG